MPELPEVQTVVNSLKPKLPGKIIQSVKCPNGYTGVFENGSLRKYNNFLIGQKLQSVYRRGKFIVIEINSGFLLIHQLTFLDGSDLFFQDIRKFGRIYICKNLKWLEQKLGVEPLSKDFTSKWLYNQLHKCNRMMKPLLLDQHFIAGLGNIYVDEALWKSGIHPKAISNRIGKKRSNHLSDSIKETLNSAILLQGTTIINFSYGQNKKGNFSDELNIFGKTDSPCPKCSKPIIKNFVGQRGTHYCRKCQRY